MFRILDNLRPACCCLEDSASEGLSKFKLAGGMSWKPQEEPVEERDLGKLSGIIIGRDVLTTE
jgi:hypothetical protein